jgi:uncharacterized protein (TIGR03437 family)
MERLLRSLWLPVLILGAWLPAFGRSDGLPVKHTGAPADGGQDCASCHRMGAPDPRGSVTIQTGPYQPGGTQKIRITVSHPDRSRWGFQLTARALNAVTREAGTFTPIGDVRVYCGPEGATQSPCENALEFATHAGAASEARSKTWELDWMAPATENGRIRLYVSALAANGDGRTDGDLTYTAHADVPWVGACPLTPRMPSISSVENAASLLRDAGISMNSLITIKGLGFTEPALMREAGPGDFEDGKYPTKLACVGVKIDEQYVPLTFVTKDQINAQAPTLEGKTVNLQVVLNPGRDNEIRGPVWSGVALRTYSPAFFVFHPSKSIAAQLYPNYDILADPNVVPGGRIGRAGDIVFLYGTGFGPSIPVYQAGEVPPGPAELPRNYTITVGGVTLRPEEILYGGVAPGLISGVYQFSIRIPNGVPGGDVPVTIRIGGVQTQDGATIPLVRPN